MKKLNCCYLIYTLLLTLNSAAAFDYGENDKNMFYNAFLDGYLTEISKSLNKLDIEQDKKDKYITDLKRNINRNELINSSWECIKSYPIEQIVAASVICTSEWTSSQKEKNKNLFELINAPVTSK